MALATLQASSTWSLQVYSRKTSGHDFVGFFITFVMFSEHHLWLLEEDAHVAQPDTSLPRSLLPSCNYLTGVWVSHLW